MKIVFNILKSSLFFIFLIIFLLVFILILLKRLFCNLCEYTLKYLCFLYHNISFYCAYHTEMDAPTVSLTNIHWNAKSNTELDQIKTELLQRGDTSTSPISTWKQWEHLLCSHWCNFAFDWSLNYRLTCVINVHSNFINLLEGIVSSEAIFFFRSYIFR